MASMLKRLTGGMEGRGEAKDGPQLPKKGQTWVRKRVHGGYQADEDKDELLYLDYTPVCNRKTAALWLRYKPVSRSDTFPALQESRSTLPLTFDQSETVVRCGCSCALRCITKTTMSWTDP